MILYHYTAAQYLRAIARYGLTVGDVPTDIRRNRGRVGVWFTSTASPGGHGLEASALSKMSYRLTVEIPDESVQLVKWSEWAPENATAKTIDALHAAAGEYEGEGPASWYIYFGVLPASSIRLCVDMASGKEVENWGEVSPSALDRKAVPPSRRDAWHRRLLKDVKRTLRG